MTLFSIDGKFAQFMTKIFDLTVLNFLFIVTSLPIFTIGSSCTALYSITLKMSKNHDSYIFKSFFKSWKKAFRQVTPVWILLLFLGIALTADRILINYMDIQFQYFKIFFSTVLLLWVMTLYYIFPLFSYFNTSSKQTLKNAVLMSIRHLPWTIVMIISNILPFIAILICPPVISAIIIFFLIIIGFSSLALLNSYIFDRKIFPNYQ